MFSGLKKSQVEEFWKELVFRIRPRIVPNGLELKNCTERPSGFRIEWAFL